MEEDLKKEIHYGSLSDLYEDLNSEDHEKRQQALRYIADHGWKGSLDYLIKMLDREDNKFVIATLIKVIGQQGQKKVIDFIRSYLSHPDNRIRANTVEALGNIDDGSIFDIIAPLLCDPDRRVCLNAVHAIWKFNPEKSLNKLEVLIKSDKASVRRSALFVLGEIDDPRIKKVVYCVLTDENEEIKKKAEGIIKKLKMLYPEGEASEAGEEEDDEYEQIVNSLHISDYKGRINSITNMMKSGDAGFVQPLIEYLPCEENEFAIASLVLALGKLGGKNVVPILKKFLNHKNHRVRANAVEGLSFTGDENAFFYIAECFHDKDNRVQANVAKALWNISPQQCLDKLREMSVSVKLMDRLSAVYALSVIGSPMCKMMLKTLVKDRDPKVASKAREGLSKIVTDIEFEPTGDPIWKQIVTSPLNKLLIPAACLAIIVVSVQLFFSVDSESDNVPDSWKLQVLQDTPHFKREQSVRQGKLSRAQFIKIKPYLKRGLWYDRKGNYTKAKKFYSRTVKLADNCSLAHNNLGFIYFREGKLNKTQIHYEKALNVNPKYVSALNNYGFLLFKLGRIPSSKSYYEKALEHEPDDPIVLNNLGYAYYTEGDLETAKSMFQKILQKDKSNTIARNNLAAVLIAEKDFESAFTELEEVVTATEDSEKISQNAEKAIEKIKTLQ